jgi:hypothetical protein
MYITRKHEIVVFTITCDSRDRREKKRENIFNLANKIPEDKIKHITKILKEPDIKTLNH